MLSEKHVKIYNDPEKKALLLIKNNIHKNPKIDGRTNAQLPCLNRQNNN